MGPGLVHVRIMQGLPDFAGYPRGPESPKKIPPEGRHLFWVGGVYRTSFENAYKFGDFRD